MKNDTNPTPIKNLTCIKNLITVTLAAVYGAVTILVAGAAEPQLAVKPVPSLIGKKEEKSTKEHDPKAPRTGLVPFRGKLDSVDKAARSVKIGDRVFQVVSTTKITKDGTQPGTLEDARVGEAVAGAYQQGDGGGFQLVSLRLGPKPEKRTSVAKKK